MIIPYTRVVGAKIFATKSQKVVGEIADVVFSGSDLSVLALLLKDSALFKRTPRAVATTDIISLNNYAVMVGNKDSVVNTKELIRAEKAMNDGFLGIGQLVITREGKKIGRVFDYLIDSTSFAITKIYVRNIFRERIIPVSVITDVQGRKIIIKDDYDLAEIETTLAVEAA